MNNISNFYATEHWGTAYGKVDHLHPNGHRGQDIVCDSRQKVPALRSGTVVQVQYSSVLGNTIVIKHGFLQYDGYSHQVNIRVRVGSTVTAGQFISEAAGWEDNHGSAWIGPHLHITNGPLTSSIFYGLTRDPRPYIRTAISNTQTAGTGTTTPVKAPTITIPKDDEMILLKSKKSGKFYAVSEFTDSGVLPLADAQAISAVYGKSTAADSKDIIAVRRIAAANRHKLISEIATASASAVAGKLVNVPVDGASLNRENASIAADES